MPMSSKLTWRTALASHWREYLIEGWALGTFMVSASLFTLWFEKPGSPLNHAIVNGDVRRALIGLAMGVTAVLLIYSPWGKRSGAHMNPAVTAAFFSLGRIDVRNAVFYIAAQFIGGALGVLLVWSVYGDVFAGPPVSFIATLPGRAGTGAAFAAELAMSLAMMLTVLIISQHARWSRFTGVAAGILVASFISFEAPLSGMSINPARSLASALPGGMWHAFWIYLTAPILGMWIATRLFTLIKPKTGCAHLSTHSTTTTCLHCGHTP
jgi:aquaporin Z